MNSAGAENEDISGGSLLVTHESHMTNSILLNGYDDYEPRYIAMCSPDSTEQDATVLTEHDAAEFAQLTLESVFAQCSEGIFVTDCDGMIRSSNPKATELFGYMRLELIGMKIESLLPDRFRDRFPTDRQDYNSRPRTREMGRAMKLFGLRKDGTE